MFAANLKDARGAHSTNFYARGTPALLAEICKVDSVTNKDVINDDFTHACLSDVRGDQSSE